MKIKEFKEFKSFKEIDSLMDKAELEISLLLLRDYLEKNAVPLDEEARAVIEDKFLDLLA